MDVSKKWVSNKLSDQSNLIHGKRRFPSSWTFLKSEQVACQTKVIETWKGNSAEFTSWKSVMQASPNNIYLLLLTHLPLLLMMVMMLNNKNNNNNNNNTNNNDDDGDDADNKH